jgi:hypothetical protein
LSWLVGGAVVIGLGYFAFQKGLFNQAFDLVNNAIKGGGSTKDEELYPGEKEDEAKTPGGTPAPVAGKCPSGKVLCKDQKCETQAECDKEGKCKTGEHWDGDTQKCVKAAKLALSYLGGSTSPYATHRFYAVVQ